MHFDVRLQTAGGGIRVMIPEDFCGNCLTPEPYLHSHPTYELHYIRTGSGALLSEKEPLPFSQGQLLLLPPDYLHAIRPDSDEFTNMTFLFQPERSGLTAPLDSLLCPEPRCFAVSQEAGSRLLRIRQELLAQHTAYATVIQGELTALMAELARTLSHTPAILPHPEEEHRSAQIERYLLANRFRPDCSCEALARQLYLSPRQVQRLCMQYFHTPFRQLLLRARMEAAQQRLRSGKLPIAELALQLGYASTASFSSAYKRYFGHAPTWDSGEISSE